MKKLLYLLVLSVLASCSSNKYAAHFQNVKPYEPLYAEANTVPGSAPKTIRPAIEPEQLTASTEIVPVVTESTPTVDVRKTYIQMTKAERKELRQNLRSALKASVASSKLSPESSKASQGMDPDLKLAAIFGSIGVVALIIGGDVFAIIGGIAMIVGLVFFVRWLVRQ
ncbi:MAG: hypothetical protein ACK5V5_11335 [Cyclobacteriaceae bacterium]|jgi:hypothetical protein|nr:hypothetical protein [Flammeovirgaceae bacterium]